MPDISMCFNYTCPLRNECYRYRVVPNPLRQSYSPFQFGETGCEYFAQITEEEEENNHRLLPVRVCDSVNKRFLQVEEQQ